MAHSSATWTREQALEAGKRGREARIRNAAKRRELRAHADKVYRAPSSLVALQEVIATYYATFIKLPPASPQAERLSRTLLNLEQIRRIHSKGKPAGSQAPAVPQQGPIGIDESAPGQDNGGESELPGDSDPPAFAPVD